jgi:hypothetical protein
MEVVVKDLDFKEKSSLLSKLDSYLVHTDKSIPFGDYRDPARYSGWREMLAESMDENGLLFRINGATLERCLEMALKATTILMVYSYEGYLTGIKRDETDSPVGVLYCPSTKCGNQDRLQSDLEYIMGVVNGEYKKVSIQSDGETLYEFDEPLNKREIELVKTTLKEVKGAKLV